MCGCVLSTVGINVNVVCCCSLAKLVTFVAKMCDAESEQRGREKLLKTPNSSSLIIKVTEWPNRHLKYTH